jgi:CheY-like chemotaxis protein
MYIVFLFNHLALQLADGWNSAERSAKQRDADADWKALFMAGSAKISKTEFDVLIIEDDLDDAYLLKRALNKVAAEKNVTLAVTHSVNGLDALGSVARDDLLNRLPDVIVVDLNMPLVDGDRFLVLLRTDMRLGDVPAAVLTTSTEKPVHAKAMASGANAVFSKPNSQDELVEIARQILSMGGFPPSVTVGGAVI